MTMTDGKLTIAELMEGGLALLLSRPFAVGVFVVLEALIAYGLLWTEARYDLGYLLASLLSLGGQTLASSVLVLAIGDRDREILSDPVEVFIRLAFVMAATLIVLLGSSVASLLLIVPGLYVAARWMLVLPIILLEGAGVTQSLRKSWELTEQSVWALVAVSVIVIVPSGALGFFADGWAGIEFPPSITTVLELLAGACLAAFQVTVCVFAHRTLSPASDQLAEVFA